VLLTGGDPLGDRFFYKTFYGHLSTNQSRNLMHYSSITAYVIRTVKGRQEENWAPRWFYVIDVYKPLMTLRLLSTDTSTEIVTDIRGSLSRIATSFLLLVLMPWEMKGQGSISETTSC
jgi:hypothetical protein